MDFTEEQVKNLEDVFRQNLPPDKDSLTLTEFKKLMPSKNVGKYHKSVWKSKSFLIEMFLSPMYSYYWSLKSIFWFITRYSSWSELLRYLIEMGMATYRWQSLLIRCINLLERVKLKKSYFSSKFTILMVCANNNSLINWWYINDPL